MWLLGCCSGLVGEVRGAAATDLHEDDPEGQQKHRRPACVRMLLLEQQPRREQRLVWKGREREWSEWSECWLRLLRRWRLRRWRLGKVRGAAAVFSHREDLQLVRDLERDGVEVRERRVDDVVLDRVQQRGHRHARELVGHAEESARDGADGGAAGARAAVDGDDRGDELEQLRAQKYKKENLFGRARGCEREKSAM